MSNDSEPIEDLRLSAHVCETLRRAGITSVDQLLAMTYGDFVGMGLGEDQVDDLIEKLRDH